MTLGAGFLARSKRRAGRLLRVLTGRRAAGVLEIPAAGAVVAAGRIDLVGWALPVRRPPGRIEVLIDGIDAGRARPLGMSRPDVARRWSEPSAPLAGYTHAVTVGATGGTRTRITVDVVDIDGRRTTVSDIHVRVDPGPPSLAPAPTPPIARPQWSRHDPLRVLVFTHQLDLGGGQLYLQEVLRELRRDDAFSIVVVTGKDGVLRAELEQLGIKVLVVPYPARSRDDYAACVDLLQFIATTHEPDIVLVNTVTAAIGADVALRMGIPSVWAIHESYSLEDYWIAAYGVRGIAPEVKACQVRALRSTPVVLFEADATRAVYAPAVPAEHSATLRYGVPVDAIDEYMKAHDRDDVRRALNLPDDAVVMLCMGTFEPRKAQGALAVAFAETAHDHPHAVLAMVGDIGTDYSLGVRAVVERLQLGRRIRVEPVTEDPFAWYRAADVFVIASDIESMPRTVFEAMAFGLPVVATAVWGIPEVIRDGENGLLYEPRDLGAMRDAMRRVLDASPDERRRIGAAAARTAREQHDAAGYVTTFRYLLPALAAEPSASIDDLLASRTG